MFYRVHSSLLCGVAVIPVEGTVIEETTGQVSFFHAGHKTSALDTDRVEILEGIVRGHDGEPYRGSADPMLIAQAGTIKTVKDLL